MPSQRQRRTCPIQTFASVQKIYAYEPETEHRRAQQTCPDIERAGFGCPEAIFFPADRPVPIGTLTAKSHCQDANRQDAQRPWNLDALAHGAVLAFPRSYSGVT